MFRDFSRNFIRLKSKTITPSTRPFVVKGQEISHRTTDLLEDYIRVNVLRNVTCFSSMF